MKRPVRLIVCGLAIASAIAVQPYRVVMVNGFSMNPTYESGQMLLTSGFVPNLQHGQVVVFKHDGETLVKRIAFLPGDRILEMSVYGKWMPPPNDFLLTVERRHHYKQRYETIAPGYVFVVGDNFDMSVDSRSFGPVPISGIFGRVLAEPEPCRLQGFAGAQLRDEETHQLVVRRAPLSPDIQARVKPLLARLDKTSSRASGKSSVRVQ